MNLLQIIEISSNLQYKQKRRTQKEEWAGPCPFCGGEDRFIIWPVENSYWCRQCLRSGGAVKFISEFYNITISQAFRRLESDFGVDSSDYVPKTKEEIPTAPTLNDCRSFKLDIGHVENWHKTGRDKAIKYFGRWGLTTQDIDRHSLGYYDCGTHEVYTIPHFWLQDEQYYLKGVKLRNVIPSIDEDGDWIDSIDKKMRFATVSGSHTNGVFNPRWTSNPDGSRDGGVVNQLCIVESEKDCILLEGLGIPTIRLSYEHATVYYLPYILKNVIEPILIFDADGGTGLTHMLKVSKYLKTPRRYESTEKLGVKSPSDLAKEFGQDAVLEWLKSINVDTIDNLC